MFYLVGVMLPDGRPIQVVEEPIDPNVEIPAGLIAFGYMTEGDPAHAGHSFPVALLQTATPDLYVYDVTESGAIDQSIRLGRYVWVPEED